MKGLINDQRAWRLRLIPILKVFSCFTLCLLQACQVLFPSEGHMLVEGLVQLLELRRTEASVRLA